ncbi:MAG TPA: efflux RND transporter permease subunit [Pirellulaceae bacterium]|nr:efflux RND transporter permease subunit [Pirellulaceae bacterium]HMO91045.1 efflux RND transporter permease subunit [Pirellulaceae bacterium]HMP68160.1 efflux RND transporter permease subunit [Pirellulaceae bacterium]
MTRQSFSTLFFRDRRLLMLAICLILVSGLSSMVVMPRLEDPELAPRAANVTTRLPGVDARLVETLVTEKIEDEIKQIQQVKEIRSTSRLGVSFIQIELLDSVTAAEAPAIWSKVRGKVDDAQAYLPPQASRPEFDQIEIKAFAMLVGLKWQTKAPASPAALARWARFVQERLRELPGTEKTELFGDPQEEILVTVNPEDATALALTAADISAQIGASDSKQSAGQIRTPDGNLLLEVSGDIESLLRLAQTPIRVNDDGVIIQLGELARIERAELDPPATMATISGSRGVVIGALVRNDFRIDRWSHQALELLDEIRAELPGGLELELVFHQAPYVQTRLASLVGNLFLGGFAVFLVIFIIMGWRSALIVGSALPLVSLMVISLLRLLDIPIHQMSVTGLIIALGLLIDNAIVVVDEINQELKKGIPALQSVSNTVRLLAVPLLGSTLTTAFAFAPIALMPGPAGEFVGAIAISVILAIFSSFLLAMTIIPALAAIGSAERVKRTSWWTDGFSSHRLSVIWDRCIASLLARPALGVVLSLALPVAGFVAATRLPLQFFPPAERDQVHVEVELGSAASLQESIALTELISEELQRDPSVVNVHWFIGESVPVFYYNLVPSRKNSPRYAQAIVQRNTAGATVEFVRNWQHKLQQLYPQSLLLVRQLEQGPPFYAPIEVQIFGPDIDELQRLGDEVRLHLCETPRVINTRSELSEALPKVSFDVDEGLTRQLGLNHTRIANQLNETLEGAVGGSILEGTEELPIRVRIGDQDRGNLNRVATLNLLNFEATTAAAGNRGQQAGNRTRPEFIGIPLSTMGSMGLKAEPAGIPRLNGRRMNEVQGFILAGELTAPILSDFQQRLAASGFNLPQGYQIKYAGETAKRDDAIGNLMANVGVLLVLMLATLVLSFKSFRLMSLIGIVAFLSVGLSMGALWLYGFPFGFMAIVGTMGLIGVAINDSIVVLAAIRGDAQARTGDRGAIREVVMRSTRHILATTLTTTAGFLPLILAGGAFWPPLAVAISGGILGATLLALVLIPSAYALMYRPQTTDAAWRTRPPVFHLSSTAKLQPTAGSVAD